MSERMDGIYGKIREKQALERAARAMLLEQRRPLGVKLSFSALGGVILALLPWAGAAQACLH